MQTDDSALASFFWNDVLFSNFSSLALLIKPVSMRMDGISAALSTANDACFGCLNLI
jgi:hypothetical protein